MQDKAIDLIDEAGSSIRLQIDSKPESLDKLERRIIQLKLEDNALAKEKDDARREDKKEAKEDFEDFPEASNPQQPGRDAFYSYFPSCSLNVA